MPEKFKTYRDVIELWRSRSALARFLTDAGAKTNASTVRTWWSMDFVPEKKFMAVAAAAAACGFEGVTYAMLNSLRPGAATLPPSIVKDIDHGRQAP